MDARYLSKPPWEYRLGWDTINKSYCRIPTDYIPSGCVWIKKIKKARGNIPLGYTYDAFGIKIDFWGLPRRK